MSRSSSRIGSAAPAPLPMTTFSPMLNLEDSSAPALAKPKETYWRFGNTARTPLDEYEIMLLEEAWAKLVTGRDGAATEKMVIVEVLAAVQLPLSPTAVRLLNERFEQLNQRVIFPQLIELVEKLKTLHALWLNVVSGKKFDDDILDAFVAVCGDKKADPGESNNNNDNSALGGEGMESTSQLAPMLNAAETPIGKEMSKGKKKKTINDEGGSPSSILVAATPKGAQKRVDEALRPPNEILKEQTSGFVDYKLLQTVIRCFELSMADVDALISSSDIDGNDELDFFEFANVFRARNVTPEAMSPTKKKIRDSINMTASGTFDEANVASESMETFANHLTFVPTSSADFASVIMEKRRERLRQKNIANRNARRNGEDGPSQLSDLSDDFDEDLLQDQNGGGITNALRDAVQQGGHSLQDLIAEDMAFLSTVDVPVCPVHLRLPQDRPQTHVTIHAAEQSMRSMPRWMSFSQSVRRPRHQSTVHAQANTPSAHVERHSSISPAPKPRELSPLRGGKSPSKLKKSIERSRLEEEVPCPASQHPALASANYQAFRRRFATKVTQFR